MSTLNQTRAEAKSIINSLKAIVDDSSRPMDERREARADMIKHQTELLKSYKS